MSTSVNPTPAIISEEERVALERIARALADASSSGGAGGSAARRVAPQIIGPDGMQTPLPEALVQALRPLVSALAQNQSVTVVTQGRLLTTQEAADLLNVSRPFLVKRLLGTGRIPFTLTGAHRRIAFDDVMAYKRQRDEERRQALRDLSHLSQQLGLE